MERLKGFFKNLVEYVGRMTPGQVMMLLGVVAGCLVGAIFLIGWVNDITYSTLYTNLDEAEAGEVVAYLSDNNIPYQLSDGGRAVSVPADQVYRTRIALASEGLPRNGTVGYSIFDQNNLGMTDFLMNLNFRRALEGELTRTIMQLNEVQAARVHIVMPRDRLFKQDKKDATASVVLKLKAGGLSSRQIAGITHLVASSVENLEPDNITIVDYDGNLLSSGRSADPVTGLSTSQLEVRQQVERYLENKAQTMLDDVLGPGKSVIRVTAALNFQQLERTSELYDPDAASVRSEERIRTSNSTSDKVDETNESQEDGSSETTVTNYELNKTVEHIINAVGTIDRLSVAVLVDGVYNPSENEAGEIEMIYQPRDEQELSRLAAIVRRAVGFDTQRNDQIEMVNIAFDRQNLEEEQQRLDSLYLREMLMDIARKVGYVALLVLAFLFVRKRARKLFAALGQLVPPPQPAGAPTDLVERSPATPATPSPKPREQVRMIDEMQQSARERPEEIAKVIRTMMVD
ncbi:MAG: flagellar basal-body MS-ring/collar protein FliF [Candidatus Zixiibacteriota bacterium]